jgi:hypothetical protein
VIGNLLETPIDAFEAFNYHPEDPKHEDIEDSPDSEQGNEVHGNEFSHGHNLAASIYP